MELSKRISRILKKHFKKNSVEEFAIFLKELSQNDIVEKLGVFIGHCDRAIDSQEKRVDQAQRSLDISSRELSTSIRRLTKLNRTVDAILNGIDEGLIVFDKNGLCEQIGSSAAGRHFGAEFGKEQVNFLDVARGKEIRASETLADWVELLFSNTFAFEDMALLGPARIVNTENRHISLEYKPIWKNEKEMEMDYVICISKDITEELATARDLNKQKAVVSFVRDICKDPDDYFNTRSQIQRLFEELGTLSIAPVAEKDLSKVRRLLHTLKGSCGMVGMDGLAETIHEYEDKFEIYETAAAAQETLRSVYAECRSFQEKFDEENDHILKFFEKSMDPSTDKESILKLWNLIYDNPSVPESICLEFKKTFFLKRFSSLLEKFDKTVQETSVVLNKEVEKLSFSGDQVFVNPEPYEEFLGSLSHIFKNMVDHGIECPLFREDIGKARKGTIKIETILEDSSCFHLNIFDDGQGIDVDRLREIAKNQNLEGFKNASDDELAQLIFEPQVSTKEKVSMISGRGVGLNAVKEEVLRLGGQCNVTSREGGGVKFSFSLPILQDFLDDKNSVASPGKAG